MGTCLLFLQAPHALGPPLHRSTQLFAPISKRFTIFFLQATPAILLVIQRVAGLCPQSLQLLLDLAALTQPQGHFPLQSRSSDSAVIAETPTSKSGLRGACIHWIPNVCISAIQYYPAALNSWVWHLICHAF